MWKYYFQRESRKVQSQRGELERLFTTVWWKGRFTVLPVQCYDKSYTHTVLDPRKVEVFSNYNYLSLLNYSCLWWWHGWRNGTKDTPLIKHHDTVFPVCLISFGTAGKQYLLSILSTLTWSLDWFRFWLIAVQLYMFYICYTLLYVSG